LVNSEGRWTEPEMLAESEIVAIRYMDDAHGKMESSRTDHQSCYRRQRRRGKPRLY